MMKHYSIITGGFYLAAMRGDYEAAGTWPADAVEVSADDEVLLRDAIASGATVDADGAGGWTITPRPPVPLAEITAAIWDRIKAERDRRQAGGTKVGVDWFHSDADSRIKQIALVIMGASIPPGLQWKTMSGEFVPMTQSLAGQIFAAAAASDQALFAQAELHNAAMLASADPAAYDFSTGWPLVYGE